MKRFIFIVLVFIGVNGFGQQPVFISAPGNNIYSINLNNCTSRLVGKAASPFIDIAFTPDGKLWGLNSGLWQIDTSNAAITYIGYSKGTNGAGLVALNDSTLLGQWYDSLEAINVKTAQSTYIGKVGYTADGDMSWYGTDLYLTGENQTYRGLIIKIQFNDTYTAITNSAPINNVNDPTPLIYGLVTVFINRVETLVAFADDANSSVYTVSPVDGSLQLLCLSLPPTDGAASLSFPSSLPIHLLNFTSTILNKSVNLQWQTASEINSSYFLIERGSDGVNFSSIGKVNAAGNSSSLKQYSFTDNSPLAGVVYYRLKEVDLDAKYTYSKIVQVNIPQTQALVLLGNPVQNVLQIQINNSTLSTNCLSIFDFSGRRLKTFTAQTGVQNIDVSFLSAGIYVLQMITADGEIYNERFVKK